MPAPALSKSEPNSTKRNTNEVETPSAMPNTPSVVIHWWFMTTDSDLALWAMIPGIQGPRKV